MSGQTRQGKFEAVARVALFALPVVALAAAPGFLPAPMVTAKAWFLTSAIAVAAAAYGVLLCLDPRQYRPRLTGLSGAAVVFFAVLALATVLSVDPARSFWGNYDRMSGLFFLLHYGAAFFLLGALFDERQFERIFSVLLWAGALVLAFAFLERADVIFTARAHERIAGTLGSAASLSLFSLYVGVMALWRFARARTRWWYALLSVAAAVAIALTQTRATMLAALVAGFVTAVVYALFTRQRTARLKIFVLAGFVLCAFLLGGWFGRGYLARLPVAERFANPAIFEKGASTRLAAWRYAYYGWRAHPMLGWGPFTFLYVFNEYYEPELVRHGLGETWFDNPHNQWLEMLVSAGFAGLAAYAALWILAAFFLLRRARRHGGFADSAPWFFLLTAHAVYLLFSFDDVTTWLLFFLLIAYIERMCAPVRRRRQAAGRFGASASAVLVVAAVFFWQTTGTQVYAAALAERGERVLKSTGDTARWYHLYGQAIAADTPFRADTALALARTVRDLELPASVRGADTKRIFLETISILQDAAQRHKRNPFFTLFAADVYLQMHRQFADAEAADEAVRLYEETLQRAPRRAQVLLQTADAYVFLGKPEQAYKTAHAAYALYPHDARITKLYADRLQMWGAVFGTSGMVEEALGLYAKAVVMNPGYAQAYFAWAHALLGAGLRDEAIIRARSGLEVEPDDPALAELYQVFLEEYENSAG